MSFRRLVDDDLPMMHRWLNEPGVVRWWEGDDVFWEGVQRDYGSSCPDPTEHWIASTAGRDIGWIQCYAAADYPDEEEVRQWWALGIQRTAGGIDYLIAEPRDRGHGLGSAMIHAFVEDVAFPRHSAWTQICASPQRANTASWRALEKAGFRHVGDFDSAKVGPCRLMALDRPTDLSGASPQK